MLLHRSGLTLLLSLPLSLSSTCLWFNGGCQTGCSQCKNGCGHGQTSYGGPCCPQAVTWTPTLPKEFWTDPSIIGEYARAHPWRSPGHAPIIDPCGVAGGNTEQGDPGNGAYPPVGVEQGAMGSSLPERTDTEKTVWKIGSTAEVAWDITANHASAQCDPPNRTAQLANNMSAHEF